MAAVEQSLKERHNLQLNVRLGGKDSTSGEAADGTEAGGLSSGHVEEASLFVGEEGKAGAGGSGGQGVQFTKAAAATLNGGPILSL